MPFQETPLFTKGTRGKVNAMSCYTPEEARKSESTIEMENFLPHQSWKWLCKISMGNKNTTYALVCQQAEKKQRAFFTFFWFGVGVLLFLRIYISGFVCKCV